MTPSPLVRHPAARAAFALLATLLAGASAPAAARAPKNALVGTWRLVRYIDTPEGGTPIEAFGANPIGLFIFTADGHVSISIMRNPPDIAAPTQDPDPDACQPVWYCAYFGTYEVDYAKGEWVTHVQGGNVPAYLGTDQRRPFRIERGNLVIAASYVADGKNMRAERLLVREGVAKR